MKTKGEYHMSLMKTLAKVAIGVAVAKGASSVMGGGRSGQGGGLGGLLGSLAGGAGGAGAGGLGGMLGGLAGGSGQSQSYGGSHSPSGGGLEDMLGGVLGGGQQQQGGMQGGLGGMLEQLGGGAAGGGGGLGGLLGGLAGAAGAGGLLAGAGNSVQQRPATNTRNFGDVLNSQFDANPEPEIEPSQDQEAAAGLMLAAMIQAAKSDGTFDEGERAKLLDKLGDVDAQEAAFVKQQMAAPVDIEALVSQTPNGMGPQIYAMSVLGIDLDTQDEAQYLHQLATAFGMQPADVNNIHEQLGVPTLYS